MKTSKALALQYPYMTAAGQYISTVTMRRATVQDLKEVWKEDKGFAKEVDLIAHLVGLISEDLDQMDHIDYLQLKQAYKEQYKDSKLVA